MDSLKPEEFIHIFIEKVLPGFMEESLSDSSGVIVGNRYRKI